MGIKRKTNKKNPYGPSRCERYCPYVDCCRHSKNILTTIKPPKGNIVKINSNKQYVDIKTARKDLKEAIIDALYSRNSNIHIIKAQTGLGKTEGYIQAIRESNLNCIIAVPTNELKNEIYQRLKEAGIDAVVTPELPRDVINKYGETINKFYAKGDMQGYSNFLNKLEEEFESVVMYRKNLAESMTYKKNIVTSHVRLLYLFQKEVLSTHTIIIDEDPFQTLFRVEELNYTQIDSLLHKPYLSKMVKNHIKYITKKTEKTLNKYRKFIRANHPSLTYDEKKAVYEDDTINFNLEDLINAEATIVTDDNKVHYARIRNLPAYKIIILSATVNMEVFARFFGRQNLYIEYCNIKEVKYKSKVFQYADNSYSRKWMDDNEEKVEEIKNKHKDCKLITFKKFSESNIYFGATEGRDGLKGKDLLILGTPFQNENVIKLLAACLDYDIDEINKAKLNHRQIEYGEFSFQFFTYAAKEIQNIQLYLMYNDLEQAVGRARPLSENCSIYVYSALPVNQAEIMTNNF